MKTRTLLTCSFGLMLLLMVLITVATTLRIQAINEHVAAIVDDRAVKVALATDLDQATNVQARYVREALIAHKNANEVRRALERVERAVAENEATLSQLDKMASSQGSRQLLQAVVAARGPYEAGQNEVIALLKAGKVEEAGDHLFNATRPVQRAFLAAIDAYVVAQGKRMLEGGADAKAEGDAAISTSLAIAAVAALLCAIVGYAVTRKLTRQLGGEPAAARELASAIAAGDLTCHVAVATGDQVSMMSRLATMQDSLQKLVAGVRQNAEGVAVASTQIAQGNNDLSGRTEAQASALEQTAAAMEELGTTVKLNADSARQANQLAQSASTVARQGGEVVARVVDTMKEINEGSSRIADIISVIDGIAFQTNILALNAAVEAARAGEQGRGFAVVAGEVRTLAQRSAAAAKEIKALITASVDSVSAGSQLVDRAGSTMQEVVQSIGRVTEIMGDISRASDEQSIGVQQIGQAVAQMDQATQQNAALVEQSAAAADKLRQQAGELLHSVAAFRLNGDTRAASAEAAAPQPVARPAGASRRAPVRQAGRSAQPARAAATRTARPLAVAAAAAGAE